MCNLLYLAKCGDWTRLADVISCGCTMAFKTRIVTWDSQLKEFGYKLAQMGAWYILHSLQVPSCWLWWFLFYSWCMSTCSRTDKCQQVWWKIWLHLTAMKFLSSNFKTLMTIFKKVTVRIKVLNILNPESVGKDKNKPRGTRCWCNSSCKCHYNNMGRWHQHLFTRMLLPA